MNDPRFGRIIVKENSAPGTKKVVIAEHSRLRTSGPRGALALCERHESVESGAELTRGDLEFSTSCTEERKVALPSTGSCPWKEQFR